MPRRKKIRVCSVCGTMEGVNPRSDLCPTCAMNKVQDSIRQLQGKAGPIFDKWRDGLARHLGEVSESG